MNKVAEIMGRNSISILTDTDVILYLLERYFSLRWGSPAHQNEPPQAKTVNHSAASNIEQRGVDTYADLWLQQIWVAEGQKVSVEIPHRRAIQVVLSPGIADGTHLRLKGQALEGGGDLYLRVHFEK